jgi:hypothetical protein
MGAPRHAQTRDGWALPACLWADQALLARNSVGQRPLIPQFAIRNPQFLHSLSYIEPSTPGARNSATPLLNS